MVIFGVFPFVGMDLEFPTYSLQMIACCSAELHKPSVKRLWIFWRYMREDLVKKYTRRKRIFSSVQIPHIQCRPNLASNAGPIQHLLGVPAIR